jgi:quercetin dioxygenase-like cupin family protein
MEDKLSNFTKRLEEFQNAMIANNDIEGVFGDGKSLVNNELIPITHNFSDQLYMRQMRMPAGSIVVSAVHHTDHFWFLMTGKILVTTNGETIEHIAPCYELSIKGAKRLIHCIEDCIFINVHKNPTNTKDMSLVEDNLYSFTIDEFNKKEKLWQEQQ